MCISFPRTNYMDDPILKLAGKGNLSHPDDNFTWYRPDTIHQVAHCLTLYFQPIICLFGVVGNIISLIVFSSKKLRTVSCNVYLAALSASNSAFLLALFIVWLEMLGIRLVHQNGWCQTVIFVTYVCSFLSIWLIVCITIENFIITFHLHDAPRLCTVSRALVVVGGLTFFAFLVYDFALWSTKETEIQNTTYCFVSDEYGTIVAVLTCVDVVITLVLPSLLIISFLIAIFIRNISQPNGFRTNLRRVLTRKERALLRVTRLLFVITVSFMIFSAPSHVNKLWYLISTLSTDKSEATQNDRVTQHLCQLVYYTSFSCNFVYYLIWGKNFRHVLFNIIKSVGKCCCKRLRPP
ncbi:B1 bradykinin receptor-like [Haliotis rubra]|uniref:B1 bradykinin receptor-like n=1 Tax=Haliotis rubra TaxID=36100 RepID=UPI001EE519E5|nr:B1 bradykinin receptor-like [Haliotis rubra]